MRQIMCVVGVLVLLPYGADAGGWGSIVQAVKKAGSDIGAEARRFGDRLAPGVQSVKEEIERFGDRLQPDVENVRNFITGRSGDSEPDNNAGQTLSIPDPEPGANTCSPLVEPSLTLDCHSEGVPVNCSEPMAVGTVAQMRCQEAYVFLEYPGYNFVTCTSEHVWSQPVIKCVADCGKRNSVGRQLVSSGERARLREFSWHVGIYKLNKTDLYSQICGGSLLTRSLVVSAAHCFWNHNLNAALPIEQFKLAAGKYHRDWYIADNETQPRDFANLYIHERFNGIKRNLAYDIAIIRVAEEFKLTWAVNVICMDYPRAFEDSHLRPGNNGTIAGWGVTENNTQSDVLMSVQLPYVDYLECGDLVAVQFQRFLTDDKMCAGFIGHNTAVCPGDSGGGYVFPHTTERGVRYYLRGIVSAGHVPTELWKRCEAQQLSAFTIVSKHRAFVERLVFNKGAVTP